MIIKNDILLIVQCTYQYRIINFDFSLDLIEFVISLPIELYGYCTRIYYFRLLL